MARRGFGSAVEDSSGIVRNDEARVGVAVEDGHCMEGMAGSGRELLGSQGLLCQAS